MFYEEASTIVEAMSTTTPSPAGPAAAPAVPTTASPSPSPASRGARRRALDWRLRFGVLCLVWGFSFLFIKVGTQGYAPLQVTFGRLAFGSVVLVAVLVAKRERLPRSARTWGHLTVAAFFLNALPFSLFAYAELTIPSTLAGICNASSPLWGMALSLVALSEDRPTRRRVAGLGLGFLGVLTVLGAWQGFSGTDPAGTAMALGASLCYPVGWIYVRRTLAGAKDSNVALSGTQMLLATAQVGVVTALFTSVPVSFPVVPLLAVVALGALGTGFAFLLQYGLVAEVGPTTAQMVTYFVPVIATAAGVALLGEPLSWNTPVGALIVLAGAALTQSRPRRRDRSSRR
ncbi:membrane protein [Streptomyces rimosus subsp. rimosus]|uniref:DMT family transporter n=2 Tax=Streptomyces rimosus subsp. rimosus TaxID=132474 RepID=L8EE71_STRR1|nr:membrane protein [Streptomyces rimosus]KOG69634.1 membrane protein [Kitasatospora aureofaciens]KOT43490.1 membrane protein [Streptomyces rimosus subsp. rimosus]KOT44506.1 membrane protein [Streptomyces sp. NRRL WC-3701]MYT42554.1 EamA family transporter [Streptomyces sp. SID5471]QGY66543.1 EamA family transporter [Streptomyces rimosus R6-500]QST79636.1 DMT family transporter [Streptomyces rimosus subsp. rimosus ATCC 10970]